MELTMKNFEDLDFNEEISLAERDLESDVDAFGPPIPTNHEPSSPNCFEDNFVEINDAAGNKLPDSQQYLALLQRKLTKVRKDNGVANQLKQKREEALERLLVGSDRLNNDYDLELESSTNAIENGVVLELIRQVRPEQPLCVGEIVHIIKHDQLQERIDNADEAEK